ncbi:methyl-accepting chemotaxis protein [Candidatus Nitrososphaera evergladensis SR1]|uniref:Methyl-accepting chemotaxis protein n=1 Tax=Candidatus Nitrososphaera evergladensis SR1 TaxID=1459636 RepID=A0A075MT55_9ARCH|nr:methyl-accepting chemotaxis protein [Candidatus Nitrososphaera evergladensis]AIF84395.1 methyl-accepting chemotaxis protein [Candidatus Nitrososphaera evergladensis SR1]
MHVEHAQENTRDNSSLETVAKLSEMLSSKTETAINEIDHINGETQVLAINALIEASRAGEAGKAFSVVAEEMSRLSRKIVDTTDKLRKESRGTISELKNLIKMQATNIRGVRLSDLALTNIDLIDRNLYERSCDVRWWAKDASMVAALSEKTQEGRDMASTRLGVILDAYTVYFDLVLCDIDGNVIANGRPQQFRSQGTNQRNAAWFESAMSTASNDQFGFQAVHRSPLVNDQMAVIFSCCVRENCQSNGKVLGVLGTVFNWEALAQEIVNKTPLSREEKANSRVCIVDGKGTVLADTDGKVLEDSIHFAGDAEVYGTSKGFVMKKYNDNDSCIAYAASTGYETYSSGWHSIVIQKLNSR